MRATITPELFQAFQFAAQAFRYRDHDQRGKLNTQPSGNKFLCGVEKSSLKSDKLSTVTNDWDYRR